MASLLFSLVCIATVRLVLRENNLDAITYVANNLGTQTLGKPAGTPPCCGNSCSLNNYRSHKKCMKPTNLFHSSRGSTAMTYAACAHSLHGVCGFLSAG